MKKIILTLLLIVITQISFAQDCNMSELVSKKWRLHSFPKTYLVFDDKEYSQEVEGFESQEHSTIQYYFSDTHDTTFDFEKLGKAKNGLYLITYSETAIGNSIHKVCTPYKIKELSEKKLVLELKNESGEILDLTYYNLPVSEIPEYVKPKKENVSYPKRYKPSISETKKGDEKELRKEIQRQMKIVEKNKKKTH